jgi:hypothetical protein
MKCEKRSGDRSDGRMLIHPARLTKQDKNTTLPSFMHALMLHSNVSSLELTQNDVRE